MVLGASDSASWSSCWLGLKGEAPLGGSGGGRPPFGGGGGRGLRSGGGGGPGGDGTDFPGGGFNGGSGTTPVVSREDTSGCDES